MKAILLSLFAATTLAGAAIAQPAPVTKDPTTAPAGDYALDKMHHSIIARVPHGGGMSYNVFRFDATDGTLKWDPAQPANSALSVTINPASITTPVPGFGAELSGPKWLKTGEFAQATFVSKSIRATGPTTGEITGDLTFMGKTQPVTLKTELVGAGKNMRGAATLGFHAEGKMKPAAFGLVTMGPPAMDVDLVLDAEFNKKP